MRRFKALCLVEILVESCSLCLQYYASELVTVHRCSKAYVTFSDSLDIDFPTFLPASCKRRQWAKGDLVP